MTYPFTSTPFLFKHLKYFLFKNGVCFSQSRGFQFQKISRPVGPNHGGASLDTILKVNAPPLFIARRGACLFCYSKIVKCYFLQNIELFSEDKSQGRSALWN